MNKIHRLLYVFIIFVVAAPGISRAFSSPENASQPEVRLLTIQEAVQMTWAHAPEMQVADVQEKRAGEAVRESRSMVRPQVVTGTGLAYNNGFPLSIEGAAPSIFQVGLSQSLLSKKYKNLIRETEEAGKASRFNSETTENELAARTALTYFKLLQARKMIALATERLAALEKYLGIVQSMSEAGKLRPVDVLSAQTAVSSARQQLLIVSEEANIAEAELKEYTGIPSEVAVRLEEPILPDSAILADAETLYQQTLKISPEIQSAEADIRAKKFHIEAEKGERLPQLSLVGEYAVLSKANNYEDYFNKFERNNYLLGFSIQIPVFDGFRTSSRIAQSRQELSEAEHQASRIRSDLRLAVQRGVSALRIATGAEELTRNELAGIKESTRIEEQLFESGKISQMEFEETRSSLFQKELEHLDAELVLFQRKLELLHLTGNITSVFQ
jgi:outer membrane protein